MRITWPHKVVYTSQGQPAIYDEMSALLFVNGNLTVMGEEMGEEIDIVKGHMLQHLQKLMGDAEAYGWSSVRDYHAAWLQQLEQERAAWRAPWPDLKPSHHKL